MSSIDDWSQATIAEADAYHELRGNDLWTGADDVKTEALQRAWDYLRGLNWIDGTFDSELPEDVKSAQIVSALEELVSPGIMMPVIGRDAYLVKKNIAGVIIKEYSFAAPSSNIYSSVDALIRKYLTSGRYNASIIRM